MSNFLWKKKKKKVNKKIKPTDRTYFLAMLVETNIFTPYRYQAILNPGV